MLPVLPMARGIWPIRKRCMLRSRMPTFAIAVFLRCSSSVSPNVSNRRVRTRTHGGVAGVGGRPPPLCRSNRVYVEATRLSHHVFPKSYPHTISTLSPMTPPERAFPPRKLMGSVATGLNILQGRDCRPVPQTYCFSNTVVSFTFWPWAFVPVVVTVRVFPSLEITCRATVSVFPLSLVVASYVKSSIFLYATASAPLG